MATRYQFVDDSGETRLAGFLVPEPGGSLPSEWTVAAGGGLTITPDQDEAPFRANAPGGTHDGFVRAESTGGLTIVPNTDSGGTALEVMDAGGNHDIIVATPDNKLGFFNHAPAAQPTGVAVTAAGIHAALVQLGLITA